MKTTKHIALIFSILLSTSVSAADFGVELEWNTDNVKLVLNEMPQQKAEFRKLIEKGEIKDMFLSRSQINGRNVELLRFVIEADDAQQVEDKLKHLPLYQQDLVRIAHITPLGSKWLDNTPIYSNYGVTITWHKGIEALEMDRVLGIDLQRVISLNQAGLITSSYLDTQELENNLVRPTYAVAFLAQDAQHARELSHQFEAVALGYADVEVQYLGHKFSLSKASK